MDKYLFYIENYVFGGGSKYASDIIDSIVESGKIEANVFCNSKGIFDYQNKSIKVQYIDIFNEKNFCKFKKLWIRKISYLIEFVFNQFIMIFNILVFIRLLRKIKPRKVIAFNGGYPAALSCISLVFSAKLMGIPSFMTVVSIPKKRQWFSFYYDKFLDWLVGRSVHKIVANCFATKKLLNVDRGLSLSKIKVIYNGIPEILFKERKIFSKKPIIIGCISRMDYNKGVLSLVDCFKDLSKNFDINLILTGTGNAEEEIIKRISQYSLSEKVYFKGFYHGDIENILNKIDIFVLPSLWEGLPYSIIEACRAGCAVVSTDVGGVSEIIKDNYSGLLVPVDSQSSLYNAIKFLIQNPETAKTFGVNARQVYEKKFTYENMSNESRSLLI